MDTKLTLKIDSSVIEQAKLHAKENNISLSKMIENYLQAITKRTDREMEISPLVKSLSGILEDHGSDVRKDYTDFLSDKYE